jgi:hypothetical protein
MMKYASPPKKTICAEKMRLLDEYVAATSALHAAAIVLRMATGAGFPKTPDASEAAREKCVGARRALLGHKNLHGC